MQTNTAQQQQPVENFLNTLELQRLTQAIQGLSQQQLNWASGYLAGLSVNHQPAIEPSPALSATIVYATHTGNGRGIAENLAAQAEAQGLSSKVLSIADYKPRDLSKEQLLILVISTHGEGEPPEAALEFHRYLFGSRIGQLSQLQYAVFALGDSSYEFFCQAGKDVDQRLQELGAKSLLPRVDADVNFQADADNWQAQVIEQSLELIPERKDNVVNLTTNSVLHRIDRSNPFHAEIIDNRRITTDQAVAAIHHLVLEIDPQSIQYQPGDALGVWSKNDPALVAEIIEATGLYADAVVNLDGEPLSLAQALQEKLELTLLHPTVVAAWARLAFCETLLSLADDAKQLREFAQDRQLIDLISEFPASDDQAVTAEALVEILQPLQPRLYSIASSQLVADDEVHLTVSALYFEAHGRNHSGTASNFLTQRITEDDVVRIYVAENNHFRLPDNPATPIILIGAGTGIAPYRAFLQQRQAESATGKNWLVFGNRNFREDFLYQQDWVQFRKQGLLDRVSLAFSRDTTTRAYIQDRLREEGEAVYEWIQQGAHIYVCGGLEMEKGVQAALKEIFATYGNDEEQPIEQLRAEGRYLRDVY